MRHCSQVGLELSSPGSSPTATGPWAIGTPDAIIERLRELEQIGVDRVYFQHHDHKDLDSIALLGAEVLPAVR